MDLKVVILEKVIPAEHNALDNQCLHEDLHAAAKAEDNVGSKLYERDGLADQRFQEDLHTAMKTEDDVESRLVLDAMDATVLEPLASKVRHSSPGGYHLDIVNGI